MYPVLIIASLLLLPGKQEPLSAHKNQQQFFLKNPDPCGIAKTAAADATRFSADSIFKAALQRIRTAAAKDLKEYAVCFGKDSLNLVTSSSVARGNASSSNIPVISKPFADLHNHLNGLPPDAGDVYGLLYLNTSKPAYLTRFIVTTNGQLYALVVTDSMAAAAFIKTCPPQTPAGPGFQPAFPATLVDEFREMKYRYNCSDEMALAFILEKYAAGVSLLKQFADGNFKKIRTIVIKTGSTRMFELVVCD